MKTKLILLGSCTVLLFSCMGKNAINPKFFEIKAKDDASSCTLVSDFNFTERHKDKVYAKINKEIDVKQGNAYKMDFFRNFASGSQAKGQIFNCNLEKAEGREVASEVPAEKTKPEEKSK